MNVAASVALLDDDELEQAEMLQPSHTGELELGGRTEHDVQPFEVAAPRALNGDPRIERLVERRSSFDRAEHERRCEPGSEHQQPRDAHGQPLHDSHGSRHPHNRVENRLICKIPVPGDV